MAPTIPCSLSFARSTESEDLAIEMPSRRLSAGIKRSPKSGGLLKQEDKPIPLIFDEKDRMVKDDFSKTEKPYIINIAQTPDFFRSVYENANYEERQENAEKVMSERAAAINDAQCGLCNSKTRRWEDQYLDPSMAYENQYSDCLNQYRQRSLALLILPFMSSWLLSLSSECFLGPQVQTINAAKEAADVSVDAVLVGGVIWRTASLLSLTGSILVGIGCVAQFDYEALPITLLIFSELCVEVFFGIAVTMDAGEWVSGGKSADQRISGFLLTLGVVHGVLLLTVVLAVWIKGGWKALKRQERALKETLLERSHVAVVPLGCVTLMILYFRT